MQVAKKGKRWGLPDDKPCARSVFRLAVDVSVEAVLCNQGIFLLRSRTSPLPPVEAGGASE